MDLRKERRKERRNKRKNRNKNKHLNKKESIDYNWCMHNDCILSLDYFKSENELNKHIKINHK